MRDGEWDQVSLRDEFFKPQAPAGCGKWEMGNGKWEMGLKGLKRLEKA